MMPFSVKEVADILKVSPAMVGKCRTGIRKKLGISEARGSIEEVVLGTN
jgi:predicted transcriptional regulator